MKCPKCGFNSFDFLENCKKCGQDLQTHKSKFGLRSLIFPNLGSDSAPAEEATTAEEAPAGAAGEGLDFGFDFMSEESSGEAAPTETAATEEQPTEETVTAEAATEDAAEEDFSFSAEEEEADDGFEFAAATDVDDSDGFEFAEAEDSSDDFDFSEEESVEAAAPAEDADEFVFTEADQELDDGQVEDDLDFSDTVDESEDFGDWDEPEESAEDKDRARQSADAEEPSDPFDLGGPADAERAPGEIPPEIASGIVSAAEDETTSPPEVQDAFAPETELVADAEEPVELFDTDESVDFERPPEDVPPETATSEPLESASPLATDAEFAPEAAPLVEEEEPTEPFAVEPEGLTQPTLFGFQDEEGPEATTGELEQEDIFSAEAERSGPKSPATCPPLLPRLAAGVCDLLILAIVFLLFLAAGELTLAESERNGLLPSMETLLALSGPYFLVFFALCFGYFTLFHFLTGQTPGKMLFGLRVEDLAGHPLNFSQAFLRSVGGLFSLLPAGLGYLAILFSSRRRGWNDLLAGSRMVLANDQGDGPLDELGTDH